ncbi:hypothetical protein LOZ55_005316 [Ophidiomyces ophidiicola]|nr:hypothetical protein LOZ55_005316 [Ophidiomyces ophidiicola]
MTPPAVISNAPAFGSLLLGSLSLYHALLSQCSRSFASSPKADEIRGFIKTRFRKDSKLQSISKIANALRAGHEALDLFQSYARKEKESIQRVDSLLAATRSLLKKTFEERRDQAAKATPLDRTSPTSRERLKQRSEALRVHTDRQSILSRPRPVVRGRRRVPVLVSARGIPFLRIKKPQPRSLSYTIRGLLDARWKRITIRDRLEQELLRAQDEDFWDRVTGHCDVVLWEMSVKDSLDCIKNTILAGDRVNRKMAQNMWEVVLKERELAEREAAERKKQQAKIPNPDGKSDSI